MRLHAVIIALALGLSQPVIPAPLDEGIFAKPGLEYGPMTWWHWINGNVTREGITKDLHAMHDAGIRGVQMFNTHMYLPKGPVEFGSQEWFSLVRHAIATCDSLGMKFTCMTGAGWSGSGGPWITPDRAMKKLIWSETRIGGGKVNAAIPLPKAVKGYYRDECILAVPASFKGGAIDNLDNKIMMANKGMIVLPAAIPEVAALKEEEVLDLTSSFKGGTLHCTLPEGEWTIIRFGYTITGKMSHPAAWGGEGYEVNKFDAEDVSFQYDKLMALLTDGNREYLGRTFEGILFDSYEASWQNWTSGMFDLFKEYNGYDLKPYMPVFTGRPVASAEITEQVLYDFRMLCDHLLTECFYGTMQRRAHQDGLVVYAEAQGGPVPAGAMDKVDIPMNEFWTPDTRPRYAKIKLSATQGGLRGHNVIAAEAFTSKPENGRWQNSPRTLKLPGDLAFAAGINRFCFHTYAHQPVDFAPGFSLGRYGLMMSRLTTWWNYAAPWMTYIARSQYLLQQGETVADVYIFQYDDWRYSLPSGQAKLPYGYDMKVVYPAQLDQVPSGSVIVIPGNGRTNYDSLIKMFNLAKNGCTLLLQGEAPIATPSMKDAALHQESDFAAVSRELWGDFWGGRKQRRKIGNGQVMAGYKLSEVLQELKPVPDLDLGVDLNDKVFYLHRATRDADIYYLTNQTDESFSFHAKFREGRSHAEIWHPEYGTVSDAATSLLADGTSAVDISLGPQEAIFVVFRDGNDSAHIRYDAFNSKSSEDVPVGKAWKVKFSDSGQCAEQVKLSNLVSWSESSNPQIKYYSGTATYSTMLNLSESTLSSGDAFVLDLGDVRDIARVYVNGHEVGTCWHYPYRIDITSSLKPGGNSLHIMVANTWINRVIGDEQFPADIPYSEDGAKFTTGRLTEYPSWLYESQMPPGRKRVTFYSWKHYDKNSPLTPSGLLGPVTLNIITINQ